MIRFISLHFIKLHTTRVCSDFKKFLCRKQKLFGMWMHFVMSIYLCFKVTIKNQNQCQHLILLMCSSTRVTADQVSVWFHKHTHIYRRTLSVFCLGYALDVQNMTFADYFVNVYLQNISQNSWEVNFSENSSLPDQIINLSIAEKLVVGFAVTKLNKKVTYISPEQIAEAWNVLESSGMATPRGLMFWNMKLEPDDTNDPSNMANAFNEILHTRENSEKFRPNCV